MGLLGAVASAQQPHPAFEVASVRPNKTDANPAWSAPTGRFIATNLSLRVLIVNAYGIDGYQLTGGPDWIDSDRFDISAKAPEGSQPDQATTMLMVRALLEDRFMLRVRNDTREGAVYALVLARGDGKLGPQLVRTTDDCETILAQRKAARGRGAAAPSAALTSLSKPVCSVRVMPSQTPGGVVTLTYQGGGQTIGALARQLVSFVDKPVIDRTGLTGLFDYELQLSAPRPLTTVAAPDDAPNVFDSVRQLGLELQSTRGPVEYLVIDSIERPTPD